MLLLAKHVNVAVICLTVVCEIPGRNVAGDFLIVMLIVFVYPV
jgi:hypothetical protein